MTADLAFSFLTAGPRYTASLPDDFVGPPEMSSPLTTNDGYAPRSFDFIPSAYDPGVIEPHRLLRTLTDPKGRKVDLYERLDPPPQWYLRWYLSSGSLYTHLRETEGPSHADVTVPSLGVDEGDDGAPYLLPESPLGRAVSARPGFQEEVVFRSPTRPGWSVDFRRPGYLSRGKVMRDTDSSLALLRGGADDGIEVVILAADDVAGGRELMASTLDGFRKT